MINVSDLSPYKQVNRMSTRIWLRTITTTTLTAPMTTHKNRHSAHKLLSISSINKKCQYGNLTRNSRQEAEFKLSQTSSLSKATTVTAKRYTARHLVIAKRRTKATNTKVHLVSAKQQCHLSPASFLWSRLLRRRRARSQVWANSTCRLSGS